MANTVVVVGGANIDIVAAPNEPLKEHDSNPGHSTISFGGVGRNIAENLSKLGCNVIFVSVFGDDSFSHTLIRDLENKGINTSLCKTIRGQSCSKYICINSDKGELIAAINDMSLYDHMYAAITDEAIKAMNEADLVVLDANTSQELLEKIASVCTSPIAFDAVSISKIARCSTILDRLFIFKPNLYEAEALYEALSGPEAALSAQRNNSYGLEYPLPGQEDTFPTQKDTLTGPEEPFSIQKCSFTEHESDDRLTVRKYASFLRNKGVKNVMISLGKDGVYYENENCSGIIPSMVRKIANTSGCGDAFLAGAVKGYLNGGDIKAMARYGSAAAAICAAHDETVTSGLSPDAVGKILADVTP